MRKIGYIDEDVAAQTTFYHTFKNDCNVVLYEIDEATTIESLIEKISEDQLHMLVIDYNLVETGIVEFNGDKVVNAIRKKWPELPLMVLTSNEPDALNHVKDGMMVYGKADDMNMIDIFKHKIFNTIDDFKDRIEENKTIIKTLTTKRNSTELSGPEEESLYQANLFLNRVYPDDSSITDYFTQPSHIHDLIDILKEANDFIDKVKQDLDKK